MNKMNIRDYIKKFREYLALKADATPFANNVHALYLSKKLKEYLAAKTEMVNHRAIIREVASDVDTSWVYYLMLLMAGLIALLGLLINSVAVVIGAMLISPLMGPIISSSLALTIGDLPMARRAFRTIANSVLLTILVCAVITLISPLKEQTVEILARVRPNIYDLLIASFSGIVGAVALCTKRNYLITATGVAVATAVIPPLSVVGYGVGTGQGMLALGGFFLFFTNFVAIVLTSNLVFFVMGFRTSHVESTLDSHRKRLLIIAGLLFLISIPLIYTLVVDLKKVNTKNQIEQVLKRNLNKERVSRMTDYSFQTIKGKHFITATVNTVNFIGKQMEEQMVVDLKENTGTNVDLQLEQVLVASGKLPGQNVQTGLMSGPAVTKPKPETPIDISAKVGILVAKTENELAGTIAPFPVSGVLLSFSTGREPLHVTATLHRDYPVSDDERLLLARALERSLGMPVNLTFTVSSLLPEIEFAPDGKLTPDSIKALAIIKLLPGGTGGFRFLLASSGSKNEKQLAGLKQHLITELEVREESLQLIKTRAGKKDSSGVTLRILRHKEI